jgi:hypothetical protein
MPCSKLADLKPPANAGVSSITGSTTFGCALGRNRTEGEHIRSYPPRGSYLSTRKIARPSGTRVLRAPMITAVGRVWHAQSRSPDCRFHELLVMFDLLRTCESQIPVALELDLALHLRDEATTVSSPFEREVERVTSPVFAPHGGPTEVAVQTARMPPSAERPLRRRMQTTGRDTHRVAAQPVGRVTRGRPLLR